MRALMRSLGRAALVLIPTLAILLLLLWAGFPWLAGTLAGTLADRALADTGWRLTALETGRPGPTGLRIDRLELSGPGTRIRAESLEAHWTPAFRAGPGLPGLAGGRIDAVDVARLRIEHRLQPSSPAGAPQPGAGSAPWLPSALLGRLPVNRLHLPDLRIRLAGLGDEAVPPLELEGRLDLVSGETRLEARIRGGGLPGPAGLSLEIDADDRIRLQLDNTQGEGLVGADARLRTRGPGLGIAGRLRLEPGASAALPVPSLPEISGAIEGEVLLQGEAVRLSLVPGTRIEARLPAGPDGSTLLTAAPEAPFTIRLEGDRIRSDGTLPLALQAEGPIRARAELRLSDLDGTLAAPRAELEADGRIEDDAGGWFAHGTLEFALARTEAGLLQLEPEGRITATRLGQTAEGGWQLSGLRLINRSPVEFDPVRRSLSPVILELSAGALHHGGRQADLPEEPLRIRAGREDAGVQIGLEWAAPRTALTATLRHRPETAETAVALETLQLALDPASLAARLSGLVPDLLPAGGWPLRRGRLRLEGSFGWPAEPGSGMDLGLRLEDAGLRSGPLDLDGLSATARWRGGRSGGRLEQIDLTLATAEYRTAPAAEPWRVAGIGIDAALQVRPGDGDLPELALEQLELELRRAVLAGTGIDRVRLDGTASRSSDGLRAGLRLSADALDPGVPMTDLQCGLQLDARRIDLDDCSAALLGGELRAPHGHYDTQTGSGAVPIALIGLDLGAVLALMQEPSLTGTGTLDGAVPLRIDGTPPKPSITDGFVAARPPGGSLRYAADPALLDRLDQPGLSLALKALGDFRYESLRTDVDYARDGTLDLDVTLHGASPRVESGRPIHFNLDVSQNLLRLLQSLRLSQNIGDTLERRLQERFAPDDDGPS